MCMQGDVTGTKLLHVYWVASRVDIWMPLWPGGLNKLFASGWVVLCEPSTSPNQVYYWHSRYTVNQVHILDICFNSCFRLWCWVCRGKDEEWMNVTSVCAGSRKYHQSLMKVPSLMCAVDVITGFEWMFRVVTLFCVSKCGTISNSFKLCGYLRHWWQRWIFAATGEWTRCLLCSVHWLHQVLGLDFWRSSASLHNYSRNKDCIAVNVCSGPSLWLYHWRLTFDSQNITLVELGNPDGVWTSVKISRSKTIPVQGLCCRR